MPKKILVVDDEPHIVKMVGMRLKAGRYDVVTATDGEEALRKLEDEHPDLVILDVMMPRPDGYEVLRQIKTSPEHRHLPVILLTARGSESDRDVGIRAGADGFITKPYQGRDLLAMVEDLLASKDRLG